MKYYMKNLMAGSLWLLIFLLVVPGAAAQHQTEKYSNIKIKKKSLVECATNIISNIKQLESENDPKCHTTAINIENYITGTSLSNNARNTKTKLQKQLIYNIWFNASKSGRQGGSNKLNPKDITRNCEKLLSYTYDDSGDVTINLSSGKTIVIPDLDIKHYASVAYAQRVILSVLQDDLLNENPELVNLGTSSLDELVFFLNISTLTSLKLADQLARTNNHTEISVDDFNLAWSELYATQTLSVE